MRRAFDGPKSCKVQERVGEHIARDAQVLGNEVVVALATDARVAISQVEGRIEEVFIISADVEVDGDHARRVDARSGGVYGQFSDGDIGSVDSPVADAQDFFGI